jgi:hypothetical protein
MSINSAYGAAGADPAAGYSLINCLVNYLFHVYPLHHVRCYIDTKDYAPIFVAVYVMAYLIFGIPMKCKMTIIPTIMAYLIFGITMNSK